MGKDADAVARTALSGEKYTAALDYVRAHPGMPVIPDPGTDEQALLERDVLRCLWAGDLFPLIAAVRPLDDQVQLMCITPASSAIVVTALTCPTGVHGVRVHPAGKNVAVHRADAQVTVRSVYGRVPNVAGDTRVRPAVATVEAGALLSSRVLRRLAAARTLDRGPDFGSWVQRCVRRLALDTPAQRTDLAPATAASPATAPAAALTGGMSPAPRPQFTGLTHITLPFFYLYGFLPDNNVDSLLSHLRYTCQNYDLTYRPSPAPDLQFHRGLPYGIAGRQALALVTELANAGQVHTVTGADIIAFLRAVGWPATHATAMTLFHQLRRVLDLAVSVTTGGGGAQCVVASSMLIDTSAGIATFALTHEFCSLAKTRSVRVSRHEVAAAPRLALTFDMHVCLNTAAEALTEPATLGWESLIGRLALPRSNNLRDDVLPIDQASLPGPGDSASSGSGGWRIAGLRGDIIRAIERIKPFLSYHVDITDAGVRVWPAESRPILPAARQVPSGPASTAVPEAGARSTDDLSC